jgi:hypothetical protein
MPNECYNYVRITVPDNKPELKAMLLERPFVPESYFDPPPPNGKNDAVLMEWRRENFNTDRFWANYMEPRSPHLTPNKEDISCIFQTAWAPPVFFYQKLSNIYPQLEIYYEYNEWGMGFCGHGRNSDIHVHLNYETKDELELICKDHDWYMQPFNPHFDFELVNGT